MNNSRYLKDLYNFLTFLEKQSNTKSENLIDITPSDVYM